MTFGSLFAGIGGMDLGLERAGMHCVWQVEIDGYARRVLAKHWPHVRRHDDVRTFPPEGDWSCDLIAGGFPCQDISFAGKGAGLAGKRSGLWMEFARIIRVLRPRLVLLENVSALLVRGFGRVLGDLAALGFDAEWGCIPAAAVGAPHIRDRVFIMAHSERNGWSPAAAAGLSEQLGQRANQASGKRESEAVVLVGRRQSVPGRPHTGEPGIHDSRDSQAARRRVLLAELWEPEPSVGRVADGVSDGLDRLRGLGNAVVPQVSQWLGERIIKAYEQQLQEMRGREDASQEG